MNIGERALIAKTLRQGYFWPTMKKDARNLVQKCEACQRHANKRNNWSEYVIWNTVMRTAGKDLLENRGTGAELTIQKAARKEVI